MYVCVCVCVRAHEYARMRVSVFSVRYCLVYQCVCSSVLCDVVFVSLQDEHTVKT